MRARTRRRRNAPAALVLSQVGLYGPDPAIDDLVVLVQPGSGTLRFNDVVVHRATCPLPQPDPRDDGTDVDSPVPPPIPAPPVDAQGQEICIEKPGETTVCYAELQTMVQTDATVAGRAHAWRGRRGTGG